MSIRDLPRAAEPSVPTGRDFIRQIVEDDLATGRVKRVVTRFPPEPNGYPHIGHAKSICLNFGIAAEYGGACNLRFDDTNPETEDMEYVEAMQRDIRWLGFDWGDRLFFASDYYERLYEWAVQLIRQGQAYVDSASEEAIRRHRGTVESPGTPTPDRDRPIEESLDLFARMRAGEFPDGAMVLRARIDLAAANMKMRDPLLYRIRHTEHYRRGRTWCIYPMYDWAHPLSDYIEGITHSLCTLEFENNRELYDWYLDQLVPEPHPRQIEFARLNLSSTVMSKRKLLQLVETRRVAGWDDPRMPTLAGMRRRGIPPAAIRELCERVGITKVNGTVDTALLEHVTRENLNARAPRVLCVLRPLRLVVENWPKGKVEELTAPYWPHDVPRKGSRTLQFSRELLIERDDFEEDPPPKFHRLAPGREVRLRHGYVVRCTSVVKDADGAIVEVRCTYDPATRGGEVHGRKVPGTIHWVSAAHAVPVEVRLYDRLFADEKPDAREEDFTTFLDPGSLEVVPAAMAEPGLATLAPGEHVQFERLGYFVADAVESHPGYPVFNRVVTLRDTWAKIASTDNEPPARAAKPAATERDPGGDAVVVRERVLEPGQQARADAYRAAGLAAHEAELLATDVALAAIHDRAVALYPAPRSVANWIVNDLRREAKGRDLAELPITPEAVAAIARLVDEGVVAIPIARELFARVARDGGDPAAIVEAEGLGVVRDTDALGALVDAALAAHPANVAAYRGGKTALLGFFVGQVMKAAGGKADPKLVGELVRARLEA